MENINRVFQAKNKKFVHYYSPEGENNAFNQLNGAFKRAVEEEASIHAAVKLKSVFPDDIYQKWAANHEDEPTLNKRAKLEFIKKCEELALLPEKELLELAKQSSERAASQFFYPAKNNSSLEMEINERARLLSFSSYEK